jgi:hypothetical protein
MTQTETKTTEPSPLANALRAEIQAILDKGPFTMQTARRIEEVAEAAVRVLKASGGVEQAIETVKHDQLSDVQSIAHSLTAESFGARLIQEIVALLPKLNAPKASPKALVEAIATARKHGLTDLEKELEGKLTGQLAEGEAETPAPKPTNGAGAQVEGAV